MSVAKLHEDDLVPPPRATRKAACIVAFMVLLVPVVLLVAPWLQNIPSRGRVVAFEAVDRLQRLPAPVTGRVSKTYVQEGTRVDAGAVILEMSDLDPLFAVRLEQQVELSREKLTAARESASLLQRQVESLEQSRDFAVGVARFELEMTTQKVNAANQALIAARADLEQKAADSIRKSNLHKKSLASELTMQKAVADAQGADAKVKEAAAKLALARHEESAKRSKVDKTRNELQAKLESASAKLQEARGKVATMQKDLQDALSKAQRQQTQRVVAPRDGVVFKINAANRTELIKKGETLIEFVPDTDRLAAELWVGGNDAPLITPGRPVRLQFEGWPAVQFVGWPSVAQGTFGGIVSLVDAHDDGSGRFRILVEPDPSDAPWPSQPYLRQGALVKGWVLLEEVSLGFEIWRQLNGFPPSLEAPPRTVEKAEGKKK